MAAGGSLPNGTSPEAPINVLPPPPPPVVGINFGNSYASIAVFTKEGLAECIANEDGERQIACAISFHGEEMYIGNQAKHQLVKNSQNTITGFRNLLGKKFSEIPQEKPTSSAPVIPHPDDPSVPAYKVQVLQASPAPLTRPSSSTTATNTTTTPYTSHLPTPLSEPMPSTLFLTIQEVTTIFIKSLVRSAQEFLGQEVHGAVISVPSWFGEAQRRALEKAAEEAGVRVLQLLDDAGAVAAAITTAALPPTKNGGKQQDDGLPQDRNQLVVDLGSSSLELSLLSIRSGLAYSLATLSDPTIGADLIDDKLIKFFAKEFTKRTKIPLTVCPSTDPADKRAEAKLRLAVEHTKRTLSASPAAATCSVESLKDGFDFTGSINRMRFDMEMRAIYDGVRKRVMEVIIDGGKMDLYDVDEIVYVGGSACLPGLDEALMGRGFKEDVITPFRNGSVVGGVGDPTTILARGCALQGMLLASLGGEDEGSEVRKAFRDDSVWRDVKATTNSIGLLFPEEGRRGGGGRGPAAAKFGGQWVSVLIRETSLPARRIVRFDVDLGEGEEAASRKVGFEIWEVRERVWVELVKPPKVELDDGEGADDDEEDEELIEVKEKEIVKEKCFGSISFQAKAATRTKDKKRWTTRLEVQFLVVKDGAFEVSAWEVGASRNGDKVSVVVPAAV